MTVKHLPYIFAYMRCELTAKYWC